MSSCPPAQVCTRVDQEFRELDPVEPSACKEFMHVLWDQGVVCAALVVDYGSGQVRASHVTPR